MDYLKKLARFIIPYKRYGILNIISNIFYALFSTLAMVSLMPMINVLFGEDEKVTIKPVYNGLTDIKDYLGNSINYLITSTSEQYGAQRSLLYMIILRLKKTSLTLPVCTA